jgi:hypothetical protein
MIKNIYEITTADTNQTYRVMANGQHESGTGPQLWRLDVHISSNLISSQSDRFNKSVTLFVERQTLVNIGHLPECYTDDPTSSSKEKRETLEELILRLLGQVGVYPTDITGG